MSEEDLPEELLSTYHHYQEGGWEVWETKEDSSSDISSNEGCSNQANDYNLPKFYIKDLHMSQQECEHFIFENNSFLYVYVTGTVVTQNVHKEKLCLEVSDGTGIITCLLEESLLNEIKNAKATYSKDPYIELGENSETQQATMLNYRAIQHMFKYVPSRPDLHVGSVVAIIGKLKEHHKKKYIFLSKIKIISLAEFLEDLEERRDMYNTYTYK